MTLLFDNFKQQFLDAAQAADFGKFSQLAANHPSFAMGMKNLGTKSGDTVLHLAAQSGSGDIIKFYAEKGNKLILEHKNLDGKTPLHVAAHSGQLQCVKYLLESNVDVDALKRSDWTPLMLACTKSNLEIVKELLLHGANCNISNKDGWTAFHIASREGHLDIIKFLLHSNPLVWDTRSKNGRTPLHTASLHGHLNVVRILLSEANYDVNVKDSCGTTPLMDAVSGNHNDVMEYLIIKGASVKEIDKLGRNVLHLAAEAGNLKTIIYLTKRPDIDINSQTTQGLTPLHFACKENNIDSIKLLVQLGADVTIRNKQGRTAPTTPNPASSTQNPDSEIQNLTNMNSGGKFTDQENNKERFLAAETNLEENISTEGQLGEKKEAKFGKENSTPDLEVWKYLMEDVASDEGI